MAAFGGHGLLWSIATHPRIPADLAAVQEMPARMLWQCEEMVRAFERIDRRAKLEAAADAAHRKAVGRMNKGR